MGLLNFIHYGENLGSGRERGEGRGKQQTQQKQKRTPLQLALSVLIFNIIVFWIWRKDVLFIHLYVTNQHNL
jgi:hypothetical protein